MHRTGLGGFQNFDAALTTPQVVEHRLAYMTPEWKDASNLQRRWRIRWAWRKPSPVRLAGASQEALGPVISGDEEICLERNLRRGRKPFSGKLVQPPSATGPFQNIIIRRDPGDTLPAVPIRDYYADSVVVAFRRATSDVSVASLHPKSPPVAASPMWTSSATETWKGPHSYLFHPSAKRRGSNTNLRHPRQSRGFLCMKDPAEIASIVSRIYRRQNFLWRVTTVRISGKSRDAR